MRKRPTGMTTEELKNLVAMLKMLCHALVARVAVFNKATEGATRAQNELEALESWHERYVDADAKTVMSYTVMLGMHVIGWIVEITLLANFAVWVAVQLGGAFLLRMILVLLFSFVGTAVVIGVGLLIDYYHVRGEERMARFWRKIGLAICLLQPFLILALVALLGWRSGSNPKAAILAGTHLLWLAVVAGVINAVLIYSTITADAKAYWFFKSWQIRLRRKVTRLNHDAAEADAEGVQTFMSLTEGIKTFIATQRTRPILPEINRETEEWVAQRFRALLAHPDDSLQPAD